ncbi:MAG: Rossmann-like and DUF2520 domain-containing protein [Candidatus Dormibacteria bacterium]
MTETELKIGLVGAGRMGTAIARALSQQGHQIDAVCSRSGRAAQELASLVGARVEVAPWEVARSCRATLLAVPDREIGTVAGQIAAQDSGWLRGRVVGHLAGGLGLEVLAPLGDLGAGVAVLHPLAPVPDGDPSCLEGAWATLEAVGDAHGWMREICRWLGLGVIPWGGWDRDLYHAAAVLAGVLPVVVEGLGERLARSAGMPSEVEPALRQLFSLAARNASRLGAGAGLSGPTTRADTQTLARHLRALVEVEPRLAELYQLIFDLGASGQVRPATSGGRIDG